MEEWTSSLVDVLSTRLETHNYWQRRFIHSSPSIPAAIHLGVFTQPFLQFVLDGSKTIESRFSVNRCAPYRAVHDGDMLLLKRPAGPVVAVAEVAQVWYYELDANAWAVIRRNFGPLLRIDDPEFWQRKASACFATLMRLEHVVAIDPVPCGKRDRRGWVVLERTEPGSLLPLV
jgi:hypothetical protein